MLRPRRWQKKSIRARWLIAWLVARSELPAIALGILIVVALAVYWSYPRLHGSLQRGFGPEWDCAYIPDADVCVKRVRPSK